MMINFLDILTIYISVHKHELISISIYLNFFTQVHGRLKKVTVIDLNSFSKKGCDMINNNSIKMNKLYHLLFMNNSLILFIVWKIIY